MPPVIPTLWFDTQALEAAEFYCSVFPRSQVMAVTHYDEAGPRRPGLVLTVEFSLDGSPMVALNAGPDMPFTPAISLLVECADQAQIDHYWAALGEGGSRGVCGWLTDRYGVSWQVAPVGIADALNHEDPDAAKRWMTAMRGMSKLDMGVLDAALRGDAT